MLKIAIAAVILAVTAGSAQAQQDPSYLRAKRFYESLDVQTRVNFQVTMTAAGLFSAVQTGDYGSAMHRSITEFQESRGEVGDGIPDKGQIEAIASLARPVRQGWRLNTIAIRGKSIVVPMGLGLSAERTQNGIAVRAARNRFMVDYEWFPTATLPAAYQALLSEMTRSGDVITYKIQRHDFFVIHGYQGPANRYIRSHAHDGGLLVMDMKWGSSEAPTYGDRLATVMSGSMWASMNGRYFPDFPKAIMPWDAPPVATAPAPAAPPQAASQTQPPADAPPQKKGISTGTGFFVTADGHIITNEHVVRGCEDVAVRQHDGTRSPATVQRVDRANDLAMIKIDAKDRPALKIRPAAQLGEQIAAFGFPLSSTLATSGNFTIGNVSAMQGMGDNTSEIQISAPVQNGNSGGPVVDGSGKVVGVVRSVLKPREGSTAMAPQNVNFAVSSATLMGFLASHGTPFETAQKEAPLDMTAVAAIAKASSVLIACR